MLIFWVLFHNKSIEHFSRMVAGLNLYPACTAYLLVKAVYRKSVVCLPCMILLTQPVCTIFACRMRRGCQVFRDEES